MQDDEGPDGLGWPEISAGYSRDGTPARVYSVLCSKCLTLYEAEGLLLKTEEEQDAHLRSNA